MGEIAKDAVGRLGFIRKVRVEGVKAVRLKDSAECVRSILFLI